jgi:hypothetical protein
MYGTDYSSLIVIWLVGAFIVYLIARSKELAPAGFVLASLILSPLIGLILVLISGPGNRAPCWQCRESVIRGALKCSHCGAAL